MSVTTSTNSVREYVNLPFDLTLEQAEETKRTLQENVDEAYDVSILLGGADDANGYAVGFRRVLDTGHEIHAEIHEPPQGSMQAASTTQEGTQPS